MGYEAAGMLIMLIIIFSVVWYVGEICSVLGIVFGCISSSNSKKYVNTKGLSNFKTVKNYHTAATVFMIISSVIIALWLVFWIWLGIVSGENKNNSGTVLNAANDGYFDWAVDFFASSITMLAVHIGSVIAGIVAQVKYKNAKELHEDILSGKVVPPPPPVVPMPFYPANPYQPGGYYQNGYNNPYQKTAVITTHKIHTDSITVSNIRDRTVITQIGKDMGSPLRIMPTIIKAMFSRPKTARLQPDRQIRPHRFPIPQ